MSRALRIWPFRKPPISPPPVQPDTLEGSEEEQRYKPIEWPLIARLARWYAPYKKQYALGVALGVCMVFLDLLSPRFAKWIIDLTTGFAHQTEMTADQAIWRVVQLVLMWLGVMAMSVMLNRAGILVMTSAGERVQFDIRRKLFIHLQQLSMSYYDKTKLGRIISRCTSDVGALREVNVWGLHLVLCNSLIIALAGTNLLLIEPKLFLSVVWLGPVLFIAGHIFRKKSSHAWQVVREGLTRVSTNLAENITGVRVVTAFNRQEPNLGAFNALQDQNTINNIKAARVAGVYQPVLALVSFIGKVTILGYGAYCVVIGSIGLVGSVVAAYMYWDWFMNPIITLGTFHNQLMMAMAGAERIFNLLDTKPDVVDLPDAIDLPRLSGHVVFENVTFGYNPDRPVLHDINFEAESGQMVALVGHTGSGKSSIISLIARFYQPQKGRILADGHDIRHATGHSLHKQMGLVLQVNYLFTGTVMENIRYAKPGATDEQVIEAARQVGSLSSILALADGFQTQVGERGASMSLGQRQLICFTRAFLADPRIFMLDEATSSVDTETEMLVQRSLEKLLEGRTTFVVAHRLSTIMKADLILVIDQGRIIERGTHRQLLEKGEKYAHLYKQFISQE
jgi:ATP-binding cassette subfamily B protein